MSSSKKVRLQPEDTTEEIFADTTDVLEEEQTSAILSDAVFDAATTDLGVSNQGEISQSANC